MTARLFTVLIKIDFLVQNNLKLEENLIKVLWDFNG